MRLYHRTGLLALVVLLWSCAGLHAAEERVTVAKAVVSFTALHPGQHAEAAVVVDIKNKYHAQSHKPAGEDDVPFTMKLDENPQVKLGGGIFPPGEDHNYPALGKLNIYTGRVVIRVPIDVNADAKPGPLKISGTLRYQVCSENQCYLPEKKKFEIETKVVPADEAAAPNEPEVFKGGEAPATTRPTRGSADSPPTAAANASMSAGPPAGGAGLPGSEWSTSYAFGAAFLAGLLFNIMPCVLPVLPLKAVGFYEVGQHQRSRSVMYGLVFSLGLVSVFAVLAVLVLVLRVATWGKLFSQPWFIWPMIVVLVVMAFGLFGAFTFRLPVGAYSWEPRHDTFSGNFLLGALTAILATPCTAPLLPPLLLWATTQPTYVGVPAVIMVGVGMASPYLILSALPEVARKFPRTGPWAELFKQMMGFMLLVAAAYFAAGQLIGGIEFWWVVVAAVAVAALYLMARTVQLSKNATPVAVSSVIAVVMLAGVLWWTVRVTGAIHPPGASGGGATALGTFQPYSPELFDTVRRQNKPVLVKFTANWCATCQLIEGSVFQDPSVWDTLRRDDVVVMKADFTHDNPEGERLLKTLNPAGGIPLTAVYAPGSDRPAVLASVYSSAELKAVLARTARPAAAATVATGR